MHSPEIYRWKLIKTNYEKRFRRQVPQWVLTLNRSEMMNFMSLCIRLNWCLPSKILIEGERHSGDDSLWTDRRTNADRLLEEVKHQYSVPLDLQNLPLDPAEEAMKASLRMTKSNGKK